MIRPHLSQMHVPPDVEEILYAQSFDYIFEVVVTAAEDDLAEAV
jgi:hypothetical protein